MKLYVQAVFLALFVSTMVAYGQLACGTTTTPAACPEDSFQLLYASNVTTPVLPNLGDSLVNATNTGASLTTTAAFPGYTGGNLCLNFYVFDPNEEELACCSCMVTPNGLISTSAENLLSNNFTPEHPSSTVIKVLASSATGLTTCAGSAALVTGTNAGAANNLTPGARLWGTTLHSSTGTAGGFTYGVENEFTHAGATLSAGELNRMVLLCAVSVANGSSFGLCKGCNIPAGGI